MLCSGGKKQNKQKKNPENNQIEKDIFKMKILIFKT